VTRLEAAIVNTLCYADIFKYPLTAREIHRYLISRRPTPSSSFASGLSVLLKVHLTQKNRGFYFLPGRKVIVSRRLSLRRVNHEKYTRALHLTSWLKFVPTVKAIFLTGALAMNNSDRNDDIDLMIITRTGYLWSTRLIVTTILDLFNVRRRPHQSEVSDKVCLNLWLDENYLQLPRAMQNLYTAHEVAQAKVLWDRGEIANRFLWANRWILKYLPNTPLPSPTPSLYPIPYTLYPNFFESLAYHFQRRYMKSRQTRETITSHSAFFHPKDTTAWVMREYHQRVSQYLSNS